MRCDVDFGNSDMRDFLTSLSERPPLLFEAKSGADCGVSFGGEPTVYVHNGVPSSESVFHVRSLRSGRLVREVVAPFPGYAFHLLCSLGMRLERD